MIASHLPMDPCLTSRQLASWSTPQLLNLMHSSMDQLDDRIVMVEQANDELTNQTQQLHKELVVVVKNKDQEHQMRTQVESTVDVVLVKFSQVWRTFRKVAPELPEDISLVVLVERVSLLAEAQSQLIEKTYNIQKQIKAIRLQEYENPKDMLVKITQVVVDGNTIHSSFHSWADEC